MINITCSMFLLSLHTTYVQIHETTCMHINYIERRYVVNRCRKSTELSSYLPISNFTSPRLSGWRGRDAVLTGRCVVASAGPPLPPAAAASDAAAAEDAVDDGDDADSDVSDDDDEDDVSDGRM